jgi:hypothetical protein
MRASWTIGAAAFALGACAYLPVSPAPKEANASPPIAEQPGWPRVGSTWTLAQETTGSFSGASGEIRSRALGPQDWSGRKVMAVESGENVWYFDDKKRTVAQMRAGKPVATYDPGEAVYEWPLAVGRAWQARYRYLTHATGQATDVQFDVRVEGYEKITTPAGTFDTYRISMTSPTAVLTRWYSPKLGILIKDRFERTAANRLGSGMRESILKSQDIQP